MRGAYVTVRCRLFARYAEVVGSEALDLEIPDGATVGDAVEALRARLGPGAQLPARPLAAVNREHAVWDRVLADGDELALLPPLAGG